MTDLDTRTLTLPVLRAGGGAARHGLHHRPRLRRRPRRGAVRPPPTAGWCCTTTPPAISASSPECRTPAHCPTASRPPSSRPRCGRASSPAIPASEAATTSTWCCSPTDDRRPRVEAATRELRVVLEEIAKLRGSRRLPEILRTVADPGQLADAVTAWSEADQPHQLRCSRCRGRRARRAGQRVGEGPPRRAAGDRADPRRRHRGRRQAAARVPAAPAAGGDPQGARRGRRRRRRASTAPSVAELTLPEKAANARRQGDRPAGAHGPAVARARLDPHLARPHVRAAVERRAPTTSSTSRGRAPCSTPTTTASTT